MTAFILKKEQVRERYWKITSGAVILLNAWMRPKQLERRFRWKFQTLASITTHKFKRWLLPWQCSMSVHTGFEVLILLLDLSKALIQLHIFIFLGRQNQIEMRTVEDNSYFHLHLTSYYQLFQFHQFLLLLVKLFVSDIQDHLKAV